MRCWLLGFLLIALTASPLAAQSPAPQRPPMPRGGWPREATGQGFPSRGAAERGPQERGRERRPDPGRMPPPASWNQRGSQRNESPAGHVFLDGEWLPRPYVLRMQGEQILINDRPLNSRLLLPLDTLAQQLNNDSIVVGFDGEPVVVFDAFRARKFLDVLALNPAERSLQPLEEVLPDDIERDRWQNWLATYELPADLAALVHQELSRIEALEAQGRVEIEASARLRSWAYPLTVLGMILSVGALGHLLQCPPRGPRDVKPSQRKLELCRATVISLALVALLSLLDLAWTILTAQAGQMIELNPIGRGLIEDPFLLGLFKGSLTIASCGLLLYLRRHERAQLAAWWMCLVCTLLTFRWLVLNSMFVT